VATLFVNMLILLSYPFNFVIYCTMSRQFRSTFRSMFCPASAPEIVTENTEATVHPGRIQEHTNYVTLADNGRYDQQGQQQEERQLLTVEHTAETHL